MAIRPIDIRRKEFKSGLRGYDANQVDDFLDEVADEFERIFAENQRMLEEITSLRERLQQFEELEASIQEALVQAQQVAQDLRRNAGKEAELIVREAKEQSHRILADSSGRVERVQESYEVLRKAKQDFANDFRHLLKSYLTVMDNADVASAKEIEASLRERLDLESVATARQAAETRGLDESRGLQDESTERAPEAHGLEERELEEQGGERRRDERGLDERGLGERSEPAASGPLAEAAESVTESSGRRVEGPSTPSGEPHREAAPEPEVEEPEVEPASIEGRPPEAPTTAPDRSGIDEEVDREGGMAAGQNQAADEFFEEGGPQQPTEE
ncbi:MAG: DivIVA domain-containing protein, partial [Actinomycetota bacterium]|nr:DivIVA domain-containing protein [Actinomycetota bacterium]